MGAEERAEERGYRTNTAPDEELVRRWAEHFGVRVDSFEATTGRLGLKHRVTVAATGAPDALEGFWAELDELWKSRFSPWDLLGP